METLKIIFLFIVAAAIGFVTTWLYYKSLYKKQIKDLKFEWEEKDHLLNKQIHMKLNDIEILLKKMDDHRKVSEDTNLNKNGKALISKRTGQKQFEKETIIRKNNVSD